MAGKDSQLTNIGDKKLIEEILGKESVYSIDAKTKSTSDKAYNESSRWKCEDSPTKAHFWQEHWMDGKRMWICKYCFARKDKFDIRTPKEKKREGIEGIADKRPIIKRDELV